MGHDGSGADDCALPDGNTGQNLGPVAYPDIRTYDDRALAMERAAARSLVEIIRVCRAVAMVSDEDIAAQKCTVANLDVMDATEVNALVEGDVIAYLEAGLRGTGLDALDAQA